MLSYLEQPSFLRANSEAEFISQNIPILLQLLLGLDLSELAANLTNTDTQLEVAYEKTDCFIRSVLESYPGWDSSTKGLELEAVLRSWATVTTYDLHLENISRSGYKTSRPINNGTKKTLLRQKNNLKALEGELSKIFALPTILAAVFNLTSNPNL